MISMARILGAPESVPAGKVAASRSQASRPCLQVAADVGDQVHHVGVALDHHQVVDLHAADLGDTAEVVAAQVDQHQVLGALLLVAQQLVGQLPVLLLGPPPRPGAGDGPQGGDAVLEPHHGLRR